MSRFYAILLRAILATAAVSVVVIATPTESHARKKGKKKGKKARKGKRKMARKKVRKKRRKAARRAIRRTRKVIRVAVKAERKGKKASDTLREAVVLQKAARGALKRGRYITARKFAIRARGKARLAIELNGYTPKGKEKKIVKEAPEETQPPAELSEDTTEPEEVVALIEEAESSTPSDVTSDDFGGDAETPDEADESADDTIPAEEEEAEIPAPKDYAPVSFDGTWKKVSQPCTGSQTNALWFDGDTGYIGCGENASGKGLFVSKDGGSSWGDSERKFNETRVTEVRRGDDGNLYGAGTNVDGFAIWRIDGGDRPDMTGLYKSSGTSNGFSLGDNIAVTKSGKMLGDSLTGYGFAFAPAGGAFEEKYYNNHAKLESGKDVGFSVREIIPVGEKFYAAGSTISTPAEVYLPSTHAEATSELMPVTLQSSSRSGEMYDIHVWGDNDMIAVGFSQSTRDPLIYACTSSCTNASNWDQIELYDSGIDWYGAIRDIYVQGNIIVATGEKAPTSEGGFVVVSEDKGRTWTDVTPEDMQTMSKIWRFDDGRIFVSGGSAEAWVYTP